MHNPDNLWTRKVEPQTPQPARIKSLVSHGDVTGRFGPPLWTPRTLGGMQIETVPKLPTVPTQRTMATARDGIRIQITTASNVSLCPIHCQVGCRGTAGSQFLPARAEKLEEIHSSHFAPKNLIKRYAMFDRWSTRLPACLYLVRRNRKLFTRSDHQGLIPFFTKWSNWSPSTIPQNTASPSPFEPPSI